MARRITAVLVGTLLLACVGLAQDKTEKRAAKPSTVQEDQQFDAQMQKLEDTWVSEFNTGHADRLRSYTQMTPC
jgi:hypothetical protein